MIAITVIMIMSCVQFIYDLQSLIEHYNICRLHVYFSPNLMAYPTDTQCIPITVVVITISYLKTT